jgi:hypothetical protein
VLVKYRAPLGADYEYHLEYARLYARGEPALFNQALLEVNQGPYPPLFHLLLAAFEALGMRLAGAVLLQAAILPLIFLLVAYLAHSKAGLPAAAFSLAILAGANALVDRAQLIPQSLDLILFLVAALAFIENREKLLAAALALAVWNHGAYSLLFLGGMACLATLEKRNLRAITWAAAASIPIVLLIAPYLPAQISYASGLNDPQEALIVERPAQYLNYAGVVALIAFPFSLAWGLYSQRAGDMERPASSLFSVSLFWIISMLPVLYFFSDRFASYCAIPLSIMGGMMFSRAARLYPRLGAALLAFILASSAWLCLLPWITVAWGNSLYVSAVRP